MGFPKAATIFTTSVYMQILTQMGYSRINSSLERKQKRLSFFTFGTEKDF
jgi:hypothetical protein